MNSALQLRNTYIYGLTKGKKLSSKVHFVSDQNCGDLGRVGILFVSTVLQEKKKLYMQIVSYGVTPEIRREHVISYSRNIHMNLCFKKTHKKTGWFSMCEVLKINTPTFSGHLTALLLSFLPKSPKLYNFEDDFLVSS